MNKEHWKKINTIFHTALDLPAGERPELVLRLAAGDSEVQAEVERLLEADVKAGSYLEIPLMPTQGESGGSDSIHPGDRLCGRFDVLREIAEGGMGKVFEAFDSELGAHVALKVIRAEIASNPDAVSRFRQEVRLARLISHPNVCRTFDIEHDFLKTGDGYESHEVLFLTMEFLPGETLASRLQRTGAVTYEFALIMAAQIAAGIDSAHERGIIHRDLKPGNIMLVPAESNGQIHAVITDFGLARPAVPGVDANSVGESPAHEIPAGTLSYMAPEQLEGRSPTCATDIYAFGLILFEMVTGKRAFPSDNSYDGIRRRLATTGVGAISFPPDFPLQWRTAIERCLETNPLNRPDSATEVTTILHEGARRDFPAGAETRSHLHRRTILRLWGSAACLVLVVLATMGWKLVHPSATLHVSGFTQLTHDGLTKYLGGTDGKEIYVTGGPSSISRVPVYGGQLVGVPMTVPGTNFLLLDVSRDGLDGLVGASGDMNGEGYPFTKLWVFPLRGGTPTFLGEGELGSFAADGRSVFYFDLQRDLYRVRIDGTDRTRIGSYGSRGLDVRMSPDGRLLRISRNDRIWEMSPRGEGLHEVFPDWHAPGRSCCGRWSSDGKLFAFLHFDGSAYQIWVSEESERWAHHRSDPVQLTGGPNVTYYEALPSADGKKLFIEGMTPKGELCRFDSRSGQFQPFLRGISAEFVSFSKDGKYVAYVSFPEGILWKANIDGSSSVELADGNYRAINPRWSPDGKLILFSTFSSKFPGAYIVESAGGNPKRLLPNDNETEGDPNWSPDGKKILLNGGSNDQPDKEYLRLFDLATKQISMVTGSTGLWSGRWSPDGRYIAALSWKKPALRILDLKSQRWTALSIDGGIGYPNFSSDSKYLYFHLETPKGNGIYRTSIFSGHPELIVDLKNRSLAGSAGAFMSLDPTDAPLVLRDFGSSDIYALTIERQ